MMFHIMVVDDDKSTRMYMKALLRDAGYKVSLAQNGLEALDVMEHEHIDLAVLDVMMPQMDGYQFTEELRSGNSNLPVLMVTAKQLPADRKQAYQVGTNDFMTKPVDGEELLLRIKNLLHMAKIASDRELHIGDIVLRYDELSVSRHGETMVLPQKEFQLLFKLLSYPGKIFTRIDLMDDIWGADSETGWETVTVHIGRLRKRFEGWTEFEIVSVRGLGYKAVKHV